MIPPTRGQYTRAKRHVAKGHEEEKKRLQRKGRAIGALVATPIFVAGLVRGIKSRKGPPAATTLAMPIGMGIGHLVGRHMALKRLRLSQMRGEHGHYTPLEKKAVESAITETARKTRAQILGTRRSTVKPVKHKPMIVKAPEVQPPVIEPSTQTPTQMSNVANLGAAEAIKKNRTRRTWQGAKARDKKPGPENEPEPESWRGHDF